MNISYLIIFLQQQYQFIQMQRTGKTKQFSEKNDINYSRKQESLYENNDNGTDNSQLQESSIIDKNDLAEKDKIIDQNIKLKEQIFQLSQQLQEILEKDRTRKKKIGVMSPNDDDQLLREKKGELRKQQLEIMEMKNKIYTVKRQLEKVYNNRNMINKEEDLRLLKQELRQLDEQKQGLLRIKKDQTKHLKNVNNQIQYEQKIQDLKRELNKIKEQSKLTNDRITEADRILRKNHQQYIAKQQKLRELQQRLASAKQRLKMKKPIQTITPEMINNLEEQIGILEHQRRENERLWQEKIRAIDLQFQQKKIEEERKLLILKQKQKQYRLNDLKIKQLRKLVRHNLTHDVTKKSGNEVDMSQFRHKRNIKYLDK